MLNSKDNSKLLTMYSDKIIRRGGHGWIKDAATLWRRSIQVLMGHPLGDRPRT